MTVSRSIRPGQSPLAAKTTRPVPPTLVWMTPARLRQYWPKADLPLAAFHSLCAPPRPHREPPTVATGCLPLPPPRPRRLPAPSARCARYRLGTLRGRCSYRLFLGLQGFSGEVVEREGEEGEHDDADQHVVQRVVVAEAGEGTVGGGFVEFDANAEEADDATGGDEA